MCACTVLIKYKTGILKLRAAYKFVLEIMPVAFIECKKVEGNYPLQ